jgi:hypothetical protein
MFNQIFGETEGRRIAKWTGMVLVLLSVFLLVKVISDLRRMPNIGKEVYPQSTIMVTGEACIKTNRSFFGIEKELDYFEIAKKRLEGMKRRYELFPS